MQGRWTHAKTALVAAAVATLLTTALPAIAASVGDAFALGEVNIINSKTVLRGSAGKTLQLRNTGDGFPLQLNAPDGKAPLKVNNSELVKKFNADEVDGFDANSLIRIAGDTDPDLPNGSFAVFIGGTAGQADVLSVSITAPTAGFLAMTGSVEAQNGVAADVYLCLFRLDGTDVSGSIMKSELIGTANINEDEDCTTVGFVEVAAGTHTVDLRLSSVATTTGFNDGSMWVLFVPFDGDGAGVP